MQLAHPYLTFQTGTAPKRVFHFDKNDQYLCAYPVEKLGCSKILRAKLPLVIALLVQLAALRFRCSEKPTEALLLLSQLIQHLGPDSCVELKKKVGGWSIVTAGTAEADGVLEPIEGFILQELGTCTVLIAFKPSQLTQVCM